MQLLAPPFEAYQEYAGLALKEIAPAASSFMKESTTWEKACSHVGINF